MPVTKAGRETYECKRSQGAEQHEDVLLRLNSSSQPTHRWREMDSNFRFLVARPSNRHRRSDCFLETWSGSVGEREVRIHLPPGESQMRTSHRVTRRNAAA